MGVFYHPLNASEGVTCPISRKTKPLEFIERKLCFIGDFSYNNIDWENHVGDPQSERFIELVQDNFLHQFINEASI